jgi:PAS domain-containing protein
MVGRYLRRYESVLTTLPATGTIVRRAAMSTISDFQEFSDSLRARYREMRHAAPRVLRAAEEDLPPHSRATLFEASSMLESTLEDLGAAAEELQTQNDALFAARIEVEAQGQFYRDLFELAPAVCLVTTPEGQITHANLAATYQFGRPTNALVGRFLISFVDQGERGAFRTGLTRAQRAPAVEEWPIRLVCRGAAAVNSRVRVSAQREGERVRALQWIITEDGAGDSDLL